MSNLNYESRDTFLQELADLEASLDGLLDYSCNSHICKSEAIFLIEKVQESNIEHKIAEVINALLLKKELDKSR